MSDPIYLWHLCISLEVLKLMLDTANLTDCVIVLFLMLSC